MSNSLKQKIIVFVIAFPLYFMLFFLPILGPALVGVYVGRKLSSIRDSILTSLIASIFSFFLLSILIFPSYFANILFAFLILVWQLLSMIAVAFGAMVGSLYAEMDSLSKVFKYTKKKATAPRKKEEPEFEGPVYVTCPNCGYANEESNTRCKSCGEKI